MRTGSRLLTTIAVVTCSLCAVGASWWAWKTRHRVGIVIETPEVARALQHATVGAPVMPTALPDLGSSTWQEYEAITDQDLNALLGELIKAADGGRPPILDEALVRAIESGVWYRRPPQFRVIAAAAASALLSPTVPLAPPARSRLRAVLAYAITQEEDQHLRRLSIPLVRAAGLTGDDELWSLLTRAAAAEDRRVSERAKAEIARGR